MPEETDEGRITLQDITNLLSFSVGRWGYFLFFLLGFAVSIVQLYTTFWVS